MASHAMSPEKDGQVRFAAVDEQSQDSTSETPGSVEYSEKRRRSGQLSRLMTLGAGP